MQLLREMEKFFNYSKTLTTSKYAKKTKQNKNNKKNMLIDKILEEVVIHS